MEKLDAKHALVFGFKIGFKMRIINSKVKMQIENQ